MAHTIKPGVATGDQVQEIFRYAKEKGFALPAVNVTVYLLFVFLLPGTIR